MDKKDIYEHLAKVYLDAAQKQKKKNKKYSKLPRNIFFITIAFVLGFAAFFITHLTRNKFLNTQIALVLCPEAVKINFNFDPAKKEILSLPLNRLNLNKFHILGFSTRKANPKDNTSLRIEFINKFNEKSALYLKDIPHKWQDYRINLSEFKDITDWSEMLNLSFIVEEWNTKEKAGLVYIDNVRLLR